MDGQGEFKHVSGKVLKGDFKRNQYKMDTCYVNPLDDEKSQQRVITRITGI